MEGVTYGWQKIYNKLTFAGMYFLSSFARACELYLGST